jgi:hypothetical protein
MAPIEGVIQVQGDITNARTAEVVCTTVPFTSVQMSLFYFSFEIQVEHATNLSRIRKCY